MNKAPGAIDLIIIIYYYFIVLLFYSFIKAKFAGNFVISSKL